MVTRFTEKTWNENSNFRYRNGCKGCIYAVPRPISPSILEDEFLIVFEMINGLPLRKRNKRKDEDVLQSSGYIAGIGILRNTTRKPYPIHSDSYYNKCLYKSIFRLDRSEWLGKREESNCITKIEDICFRGYTHLKRGTGITRIPAVQIQTREDILKPLENMIMQYIKKRLKEDI